jgi:hypothetical protein
MFGKPVIFSKKKHAFLCPGAVAKGVDGAAGAFEPGLRGVEVDRGAAAGGEKKLKDIKMYGIYIYIHTYVFIYIYTNTMYMMYINTNMSW